MQQIKSMALGTVEIEQLDKGFLIHLNDTLDENEVPCCLAITDNEWLDLCNLIKSIS